MKRAFAFTAYFRGALDKYKYVLLLFGLGLLLLLFPQKSAETAEVSLQPTESEDPLLLEQRLEQLLGEIKGVGKIRVLLTVRDTGETVFARNSREQAEETGSGQSVSRENELVTLNQSGSQQPVTLRKEGPVYQGAAIVCEGGGSAEVRLQITRVVESLTGLSSDRIVISKMKD